MATFVVNTFKDENNGLNLGKVSLRDAIVAASSNPGTDKIIFDRSLRNKTITLTYGALRIIENVTIAGLGANRLTIKGDTENIFQIEKLDSESEVKVTIKDLTISSTKKQPAIVNSEKLTLNNCVITNNSTAINNSGNLTLNNSTISNNKNGGIFNSGNLTINRSTISGNTSNNKGGGIYNLGTLTLSNSNISGNRVLNGNGGGGIHNMGFFRLRRSQILGNSASYGGGINNAGRLSITTTTISGNTAYNGGGGIANSQRLTISDSTIDKNTTNGQGGGVYNSGDVTLTNSTISGNSALDTGGGVYNNNLLDLRNVTVTDNEAPKGQGSGVASVDPGFNDPTTYVSNTIISGNVNTDIDFQGESNTFKSYGGNLVGVGSAQRAFRRKNDQNGVKDPKLRRLAQNGGQTITHALRSNSPAVDRGDDRLIPEKVKSDQRGSRRISGDRVDVGAYELLVTTKQQQSEDYLIGKHHNHPLVGNIHTITGKLDVDLFVLGNRNYLKFAKQGMEDYLIINGFNPHEDLLRLKGKYDDYEFHNTATGMQIFWQKNSELIALVQGVRTFELDGDNFSLV